MNQVGGKDPTSPSSINPETMVFYRSESSESRGYPSSSNQSEVVGGEGCRDGCGVLFESLDHYRQYVEEEPPEVHSPGVPQRRYTGVGKESSSDRYSSTRVSHLSRDRGGYRSQGLKFRDFT